jgi:iron only hydrogenase large subunit-like protein
MYSDEEMRIASVAPSYPAYFRCHPEQLVTALKLLGFRHVEETSSVVGMAVDMRLDEAKKRNGPIIGSSCPRIADEIMTCWPRLQDLMSEVTSPMELHGRMLREKYGSTSKLVFLSPCPWKAEENNMKRCMDEVVTFGSLEEMLLDSGISDLTKLERTPFDSTVEDPVHRLSPLVMGVHGFDECIKRLDDPNLLAEGYNELLWCSGGCFRKALKQGKSDIQIHRILEAWEE